MLTSVFLSGRLGELCGEATRYVEVDEVVPGPTGTYRVHQIPVRAPYAGKGLFFSSPKGTLVILRGRLETDPSIGLYVQLEIEEVLPLPSRAK